MLMVNKIIAQSSHDGLVVCFGLSIGLRVIHGSRQMFQGKELAEYCKELADKLLAAVCDQIVGYPL